MTPKQARFVQEYLIDLNATQAAIRAGYSAKTAQEQSSRLLSNVMVKAQIDAAVEERAKRTQIDADWLLKRLAEEATADIADLYDDNGHLRPVHEWPVIFRQGLVQGIDVEALYEGSGQDREQIGHTKKIRFDSRVKRLELIGRHVNVQAFKDQVEIGGLDGWAERVARAKQRIDAAT